MNNDRYERGLNKLKEIYGQLGDLENFKDIAPALTRYMIEFPFGDVYLG